MMTVGWEVRGKFTPQALTSSAHCRKLPTIAISWLLVYSGDLPAPRPLAAGLGGDSCVTPPRTAVRLVSVP